MDQIGRYKIVAKIGQGGTSHVFKGFDATLNRHVAIKTISADMADDPTLQKRFEREARAAAKLNHPHIITIYDFGHEGDKLYMAMELLEGVDLKQGIAQGRLGSLEAKLDVMSQICEGLAFAHANEIVHRDLKPANLYLLPDGQVKIMDFGLARVSGSDMTRTGLAMGTPHYMSPEQVRGEKVDFRSDVFSLGCVFYEILTGKKPFDADTIHAVLYKVMQDDPKPARELVPELPRVLAPILEKALAKRADQRFQSAVELGEFLDRAQEAIATGRGEETLLGLVLPSAMPAAPHPPAPPAGGPAPLPAAGPAPPGAVLHPEPHPSPAPRTEGNRSGSRPRSHPRVQAPPRSLRLGYVVGALVLLMAAGLYWYGARGSATSGGSSVDNLMQEVVRKRVELARKKLLAGDYADAAQRAEEALKLAPDNAEAKDVLTRARAVRHRIDKALAASQVEAGTVPDAAARAAYWALLQEAPNHPRVAALAAPFEAFLKDEAQEARRRCLAERTRAEALSNAPLLDAFKDGRSLQLRAEDASRAGQQATAAREFLRARERFASLR